MGNGVAVIDISNGVLSADLPQPAEGVRVLPLDQGLKDYDSQLQVLLSKLDLRGSERAFTALKRSYRRVTVDQRERSDLGQKRPMYPWQNHPQWPD